MWSEDSSTSPEQDEDTTMILQFFLLNCEVVLEPTSPSSFFVPFFPLREEEVENWVAGSTYESTVQGSLGI
jgi:hypothetical protein